MTTNISHTGAIGTASSHDERVTAEVAAGGSLTEGLAGAGALVLAIIGLAGMYPHRMVAISVIAVGAALIFEGGAVAARFRATWEEIGGGRIQAEELGGGMSAELLGGAAGVVLGILALLNVVATMLISIAAIVLGGAVMLGSMTDAKLNNLTIHDAEISARARAVARDAVYSAASAQALVGAGAVVLGILALLGTQPLVLSLVAMLSLGGVLLLSGSVLGARLMSLITHSS